MHPGGRAGEARAHPGGIVDVEIARGDAFIDDQHDVALVRSRMRYESDGLARAGGVADGFPAVKNRIGGADPRTGKTATTLAPPHDEQEGQPSERSAERRVGQRGGRKGRFGWTSKP